MHQARLLVSPDEEKMSFPLGVTALLNDMADVSGSSGVSEACDETCVTALWLSPCINGRGEGESPCLAGSLPKQV